MRLAVVGLGFMGGVHVKAAASVEGVELAAVVSRRAAEFSGNRYATLEDALADPEIDILDLCLPTDLHESATIAALGAGKHVLVEKPMALSVASCQRMIAAAERAKRILMVAHVLRFFPAYRALQRAVDQGELGSIRSATFRRRCAQPGWSDWITDKSRSGGGAFDLLIHDVDMALRLFGAPQAISATGYEDAAKGVDVVSARFYYDGFVAEISGGWMGAGGFPFAMEFTVLGDAGVLEFNSESRPLKHYGGEEVALETTDGYAAEIAYFAECCRKGEQPVLCTPESSAEAVRLALAMFEARTKNGERISWK
ncbi:MAG TPA: Gfo/Idh/MocA family oxidoreductase [Bryobacteraceae bacterium]|jgi:predicted dehydrogenase|nr:Gfo/Idh/MocA family oxidoreductase [Bryobacteraceae bacterium]